MAINKAKLERHWRVTVAVCLTYTAIITLFFVVTFYHVARVPDASQAKVVRSNEPAVHSGPAQLATAGRIK